MKLHEAKPLTTTWLDRKGTQYVFRKGTSVMSERIVIHKWHDTDEITWQHVKGDGRTPNFVVFNSGDWTADEDIDAMREFAQFQLSKAVSA